jgi:hypothetical protein
MAINLSTNMWHLNYNVVNLVHNARNDHYKKSPKWFEKVEWKIFNHAQRHFGGRILVSFRGYF